MTQFGLNFDSTLTQFFLEKSESVGEEDHGEIRAPSVSIPNLGNLPELSESFRNKLQSWDDLGAIRARNRDGNSRNLANRRRGASSASNVLHRMSLPVVFGQKTQDKRVDFKGYKIFDKTRSYTLVQCDVGIKGQQITAP